MRNFLIKKYKMNLRRLSFLSSVFAFFGCFFFSEAIRAEIENLYDGSSEQVAGVNSLMSAVVGNDVDGVKFFSKIGKLLINQKNAGGATALHIASRQGNFEIAKILIENGADVDAVDNEGWTPLMRSSLAKSPETVNLLLLRGAKANPLNSVNESAITQAALSDCTECLNLMLQKYNFIKNMDAKILKDEITGAFITARNHENRKMQDMLEGYLDIIVKSSPSISSGSQANVAENLSSTQNSQIVSGDNKKFILKQDDGLTSSQVVKTTSGKVKKFTLVVGAQGNEGKVKKSPNAKYKFSGKCNCGETSEVKKSSSQETTQKIVTQQKVVEKSSAVKFQLKSSDSSKPAEKPVVVDLTNSSKK